MRGFFLYKVSFDDFSGAKKPVFIGKNAGKRLSSACSAAGSAENTRIFVCVALNHRQLRTVYLAVHVEREYVRHARNKVYHSHNALVERRGVNLVLGRNAAQQ